MTEQQKAEAAAKSKAALKETLDKLEQGVKDVFTSENYADYLKTMSRFHNYSARNSVLIYLQNPEASLVAGYQAWQSNFGRYVKKGEKGIRIIVPSPYKTMRDVEKLDPNTKKPVIGSDGKPVTEKKEITGNAFKAISVFDISQTDGKPLPEYVHELNGDVPDYNLLFDAVKESAPCPVSIENISDPDVHGYYSQTDKKIVVRDGMSQLQTLKTLVHEVAHSKIHDIDLKSVSAEQPTNRPDKRTREVEAESIAYTVCQHYGLDTSDYSFGYIAGWSKDKDLKELGGSLNTIQATASEIITSVDERLVELKAERGQISEKFSDPEKLAAYIGSIYEQVKNADISKVAGVASLNMAGKRLQKLTSEIPSPQSVSVNGLLPLGYKALYDTAADICKKHMPNITVNDTTAALIAEKTSLMEAARDLSAITDKYAGLDHSPAKQDIKMSYAENITEQKRTVQTAYDKYCKHMIDVGLSLDRDDTPQFFEECYFVQKENAILAHEGNRALHDIGERPIEPHTPSDYGSEVVSAAAIDERNSDYIKNMWNPGDTFSIYQLKESSRELRFADCEFLEKHDIPIDIKNYDLIYTAPLNWKEDSLEKIYEKFNLDHPQDFKGHSLSISDVIVTKVNGDETAYYVDKIGFKTRLDFWDSLKPPPPDLKSLVEKASIKDKLSAASAKMQSQHKPQHPERKKSPVCMSR